MPKKQDPAPLVEAVIAGDLARTKQLVADGLDPCVTAAGEFGPDGDRGIAAVHAAFTRKVSPKLAAYLLTLPGLDWNAADVAGQTPLHVLVGRCTGADTPARVKALVAKGANPNAADKLGRTPLFELGFYYRTDGAKQVFDALVAAGADPARTDKKGHTALDLLFEDLRTVGKDTAQRVALIEHAVAMGATSRYTKAELALVGDPNLVADPGKVKKPHAAAVARSWLALARAYRRAGAPEGEGCALDTVRELSNKYELAAPRSYTKDKDFWELDIEGSTVKIVTGKLGGKSKETVEKLPDAKAATARAAALAEAQAKKFWG